MVPYKDFFEHHTPWYYYVLRPFFNWFSVDTSFESATHFLWLGRVLSTLGILIIFGALVLIGVAWPEGPEYVITVRFLRSMWALALIGTVLVLVAFTAAETDRSLGASLSPSAWFDLADAGSRLGPRPVGRPSSERPGSTESGAGCEARSRRMVNDG